MNLALPACFATVVFSSVKHSEIYCEHHETFVLNFFSAVLNKNKISFPKMDDCNFIATSFNKITVTIKYQAYCMDSKNEFDNFLRIPH